MDRVGEERVEQDRIAEHESMYFVLLYSRVGR